MNKKNVIRAVLVAASLGISTPMLVSAATEKKQYGEEYYPDWFNNLIEFSEKTDEKINKKLDELEKIKAYEMDQLMLITDTQNHAYFVPKKPLGLLSIDHFDHYYDAYGEETEDIAKALYKEIRKRYKSITNPGILFEQRTFINLETKEVTTNYQEWDGLFLVYDEENKVQYIIYPNIVNIIPEKYLNAAAFNENKLSLAELKAIEKELKEYSYQPIHFNPEEHQNPVLRKQR
ncbi:MAG: hypothetical protein IJ743_03985 [Bacilli bacterium]|nr:hypothetical protein [Bacilli bacterium]MBR1818376.1 hypothetical protein [Bacilli bacterium]